MAASARLIARAVSVEPVKHDAGDRRIGDQRGADLAVARQQLQHVGAARRPRGAARTAARRDQRRLLGRLGQHGVAGGQRRRRSGR